MPGTSATIAAIATGPAAGGIGIVRLSGPGALAAARAVTRGLPEAPAPRHAYVARFVDAAGRVLDEGLALYFAGPKSFTGEDVVELHAHGAPRLLELLLAEVLRCEGVRLATAGEFTRRAFLSGRLALTQAEAVADLIAATSEAQVRAAAAQLSGALSERLEVLKAPLLALHADLEGALDFPDEAEGAEADAAARLGPLVANARSLARDARHGALVRRGAKVVLFGPVNAGKSTLFNALVGAARALVDPEPGTTRDALEARVEWAGLAVTLVDTAGLREGAGRLEAKGIERTRDALAGCDVAVLVLPPEFNDAERAAWSGEVEAAKLLVVRGKADLGGAGGELSVSGQSGAGLEALREKLVERLGGEVGASVVSTSERHSSGLARVVEHLERAELAAKSATLEVVAGELALALDGLAELTGADARTELLDAIFARFCIGK
ncbi:MAG: tRNA uridine-5-carboxymethylaminomethyl(34) synthesis GTPase MnmE [Myxococcaceae bacterium]